MKRFSWREMALLCAPAVVLIALPLAMRSRQPHNGIRVVASRTALPSPSSVSYGADIAAHLRLDEVPDDNFGTTWKTSLRLVAGHHLLWDSQKGNVERRVMAAARSFTGAWHEWDGAFDLAPVPAQWGEVVLAWDAELTHTRTRWMRSYDEHSRRSGRIVLRRAGERLAVPKVSHDSHLKLLRFEIGSPQPTKMGNSSYPSYPIKFFFERDPPARQSAPPIYCDYKVRPWEGFMTFSSIGGSDETTRHEQDSGDAKAATARRYPVVAHTIDLVKAKSLPGKSFVDWTIRHGDYWPMRLSIPFSDAQGRVLVGTTKPR